MYTIRGIVNCSLHNNYTAKLYLKRNYLPQMERYLVYVDDSPLCQYAIIQQTDRRLTQLKKRLCTPEGNDICGMLNIRRFFNSSIVKKPT